MMIFSSKAAARRRDAPARRRAAWAVPFAAVVAAVLVAACGGGTSQYDPFVPNRLLVFGDDTSTLTADGRNYGVNGLDANNNIDCTLAPIWVQSLASSYGFAFAECNPGQIDVKAIMLASAGAKVDDVAAQVEQQVAAGGFRDKDLATVLAGTNDLLEIYADYPSLSVDVLTAEAGARGKQLALVVNRLVALGAKVVVSDLPDLGLTPFAINERNMATDIDRAALLTSLTTAFNEQLGVNLLLDGHYIGLVQAQLRFQAIQRSPSSYSLTDITDPVCLDTAAPPDCTTATLQPDAVLSAYLWADATHMSPAGQSQLATLAINRARQNPF